MPEAHAAPYYTRRVIAVEIVFWVCGGALVWTHAAYPLAARGLAALRSRRVRTDDALLPSVALIIAAHDEEAVIEDRLANLRALDYPGSASKSS